MECLTAMVIIISLLILVALCYTFFIDTPDIPNKSSRVYVWNKKLDVIIKDFILSGKSEFIGSDEHNAFFKISDDSVLKIWTSNYPYAYANRGIKIQNNKQYALWEDEMPGNDIIKKLKDYIDNEKHEQLRKEFDGNNKSDDKSNK